MKISQTLLAQASTPRRILMYLAVREVQIGKVQTFAQFAHGFRAWTKSNQGDRLLEYCLRKLATAELITLSGTFATNDLALSLTVQGDEMAKEAYQLAERGVDDFANLLPPAAVMVATPQLATPLRPNLLQIASLGSRPTIINSELS